MHSCIVAHTHTSTNTHTHIYKHTHTHLHLHTRTHARTHTHTPPKVAYQHWSLSSGVGAFWCRGWWVTGDGCVCGSHPLTRFLAHVHRHRCHQVVDDTESTLMTTRTNRLQMDSQEIHCIPPPPPHQDEIQLQENTAHF